MIKKILYRAQEEWRRTLFGKTKKNSNPLKWGVIGLGYMAETFSCTIDGSKDDVVYAVASRNLDKAKKFASKHGKCKAYGSYKDMVSDDSLNLDVIYIATPVKYHFENVKLCLEVGKNVLCEKPITSTLEELEELMKLAKEHDCFFMEGMWMKCLPTFQRACQWIAEGKIGKTELIKVDFYKREQIRTGHAIYNADESGGILRDFGVYAITFMEHFLGGYPDVISANKRISPHGIDADWNIDAEKNYVRAVVNLSANFGSLSKAAVIGTKGFIEWDSQFNRTNRVALYDENGNFIVQYSVDYSFEGFEYEVNEVHNCIVAGRKFSSIVSIDGTYNTMSILNTLVQDEK